MRRLALFVLVIPVFSALLAITLVSNDVKNAGVWCGGVATVSMFVALILGRRGKLITEK